MIKFIPRMKKNFCVFFTFKIIKKCAIYLLVFFVFIIFFCIKGKPINYQKMLLHKSYQTSCQKKEDNGSVDQLTNYDIKHKILQINSKETVYNSEKFGPLLNDSVIILIQVHRRFDNLRQLIKSLEAVESINSTLLVFSHDYYDEEIINLELKITFTKFMIIYFPYSIQSHPDKFPGVTPGDCEWNISVYKAKRKKCNMYQHPDSFGHYRQGQIAQVKHHWWWKTVRVFDGLQYTRNHNGLFLFLEEDLFVTRDLLHVLKLMNEKTKVVCSDCDILFLGSYRENDAFIDWIPDQVKIHNFNSLGFAIGRSFWNQLKECASVFCTFDDYNWDWSLRYVMQKCFKKQTKVLAASGARVFHTGQCGLHHTMKTDCSVEKPMQVINNFLEKVQNKLFPNELEFVSGEYVTPLVKRAWGGWADPRDHQLCLDIINKK